jgi:hypothetical protein
MFMMVTFRGDNALDRSLEKDIVKKTKNGLAESSDVLSWKYCAAKEQDRNSSRTADEIYILDFSSILWKSGASRPPLKSSKCSSPIHSFLLFAIPPSSSPILSA